MSDNIKILKNYLLYFLLMILVCIVGISGVFADELENIGYLNDYSEVLVEVSYSGSPLPLTRTNTYQLEQVEAMNINISNFTFLANNEYVLEFYTPNTTLSRANIFTAVGDYNNNQITCTPSIISYHDSKYLDLKFTCPSNVNYLSFRMYNTSNNYIMDSGIFSWNYVYLRKVKNTDTQDIINNQNQNTQDIINNQNQNTQQQIESQLVCFDKILKHSDTIEIGTLNSNGTITSGNYNWGVTDYIRLYDYLKIENSSSVSLYCLYDENKTLISCQTSSDGTFSLPNNAYYGRFSIRNNDIPMYTVKNCQNGNQALNDSISGLNDSLNNDDSSGATSEASEFFNSFTTNTFGLTSIITAPLNLIQSLTSSTCSELHLPLPYLNNKYLDLPCMTSIYQTHFGAFFTMYQTITYGIIAYWVCVRIFNQVKDFKNPEHDEIEVVDL